MSLQSIAARVAAGLIGLGVTGLLAVTVLSTFIGGVLADERVLPQVDTLESYLSYWPESARIQSKLAEARMMDPDRDLNGLEASARLTCRLSPFDYRHRLLLATIEEAKGDQEDAEATLEAAHSLAPNNTEVAWRRANLLLRIGKLGEAQESFRAGCERDPSLVPMTMDVVWRASGESASAVEAVTPTDRESRLNLAGFLAFHSHGSDAAAVFSGIPHDALAGLANIPAFINSMVSVGEWDLARNVWADVLGIERDRLPLVWNGGFETGPQKTLNQFDWQFGHTDYASIRMDSSVAHWGSRSLKIEFRGRDTTKLDREITQQIVLKSGSRYRLECFVKTSQLDTPEGPQIVVANQGTGEWIAATAPIGSGTDDWRAVTVDFTAPAGKAGYALLNVSVKRKPKFSYDEPTSGIVWVDDVGIRNYELGIRN